MIDLAENQFGMSSVPYSAWHIGQQHHISAESKKQHGYFLHITDMHIDEDYLEGATSSSSCHRLSHPLQTLKKKPVLAGKYGAVGAQCDAPVILAQETLDWISDNWKDKLDFVIWTGDNAKHDWDKKEKRKRRDVYNLNQRVTDMVLDTFWDAKIPVIPSFGNNDVFPHNQIAGPEVDGDLLSFYERLWRTWIPSDQRATFRQGGYFSIQAVPGIQVITLNSMYFFNRNKAVRNCLHPQSPAAQQMVWLEGQLKKARHDKHKVYIIGHVPPSPRDYKESCLTDYLRITTDFSDVILGQFFAHMNIDHFLMYGKETATSKSLNATTLGSDDDHHLFHTTRNINAYVDWLHTMYEEIEPPREDKHGSPDEPRSPFTVVQVSPSVLPVYNPSIRIYQYEKKQKHSAKPYGTLLGYEQYFADLSKWNAPHQKGPLQYELEYSTQEAYGMEDLSAESYFQLAKAMVEPTPEGARLWATYRNHMLVKTHKF
ncbi:Endopolyphosphatase [Choanephora cucurbitarum]|uniref:Endopolyphosphatase n=1 Tax=Choanephora cucurbitarum TaxID=101091 RepID=A0A1C7NDM7_9FUNG|nr:Endopolyphosphatase [Choanephora cucurbitarum]